MAHNPLPPAFNSTASTKTSNLTLQSTHLWISGTREGQPATASTFSFPAMLNARRGDGKGLAPLKNRC